MDVAKDQRSKLDSKSKPCIFMGYSEDEFSYRLWDLVDKKVVRSQDIVFMEDKIIEDWKQHWSRNLFPNQLPLLFQSTIQGELREDNHLERPSPR